MIKALQNIFVVLGLIAALTSNGQTTVSFTSTSNMSDAMVVNGSVQNSNFGNQAQMDVFHQMGQQMPMVFRTYIQYDISSIPENAIVTSATLNLYPLYINNGASHPLYIERVAYDSWSEGSITWYNQPSVINSTSDQISISHAQTTNSSVHQFDVKSHVQKMVNYPANNNGWRIRLQNEQSSTNFGISYNSSEATNSSKRPVLSVTYILPIEMTTTVSHCSAGNDDGEFSIALSGGSTYDINDMYLYQTETTVGQIGTATISNVKTTYSLQYNSGTKTVTAKDLEPGIYIFRVFDDKYTVSNDPRCIFYQHIMVGREGEVTKGILYPNNSYQDFVSISRDKPGGQNPIDRENSNYAFSNYKLDVTDSPGNYESASLMRYNIDFDDQLTFTKAEIQMKAYSQFYRDNNSSNELNLARITADWNEYSVTWNTRPNATALSAINIPTTTTIGYETSHLWDTISILPFVDFWVENPSENYGFELELDSYGNGSFADRSYKGEANNLNFIEFEFKVKVPLEIEFIDSINVGNIHVFAPEGTLPYRYMIKNGSIGSLIDEWDEIKEFDLIDSVDFFTADIDSNYYRFEHLPAGRYFIAVFDSQGNKQMEVDTILSREVVLQNNLDVEISNSQELYLSSQASSSGACRLGGDLLVDDIYGGIQFTVDDVGDCLIGFNKTSESRASSVSDIDFGVAMYDNNTLRYIENGTLSSSSVSIADGSTVKIFKDGDVFTLLLNDTEVVELTLGTLAENDLSLDIAGMGAVVRFYRIIFIGRYRRPGVATRIEYLECGVRNTGEITLVKSGYIEPLTFSFLKNNITGVEITDPISDEDGNLIFEEVPMGSYTLTTFYNNSTPPYGYSSWEIKQVAIGYVVEWEDLENSFVVPLNTIQKDPTYALGAGTANSVNTLNYNPVDPDETDENIKWIQFTSDVYNELLYGSSGLEVIHLKNIESDELAFSIINSTFSGNRGMVLDGTSEPLGHSLNNTWRIENLNSHFGIFVNGEDGVFYESSDADVGKLELSIHQLNQSRYLNTIVNFCDFIPDQFVEPKRDIKGGYFLVPSDDTLRFEFNEEYVDLVDLNLNYQVKNFKGEFQEGLDDLIQVFGDNRLLLDVSSLSSGVYILEIYNQKGEDWYLRFKVQ